MANISRFQHEPGPDDIVVSVDYHRHRTSGLRYTDGVQTMAEIYDAFWLIDVIGSYQAEFTPTVQALQHWTLEVQNGRGTVICRDVFQNEVARQVIEYTDFPLPVTHLTVEDGVLLLPSEQ